MPSDEREALLGTLGLWAERARAFTGWDLPVQARVLDAGQPWDYAEEVRRLGAFASAAVDFGTGGGERLAEMRDGLPARLIATEEWHVNAPIARNWLRPLGVPVIRADSLRPPFADASFDLVLSRHEAISTREVARIVRPAAPSSRSRLASTTGRS
ncbi:MAG: methyltransferase domain-containing protein [Tepidiformaceae bacterium]